MLASAHAPVYLPHRLDQPVAVIHVESADRSHEVRRLLNEAQLQPKRARRLIRHVITQAAEAARLGLGLGLGLELGLGLGLANSDSP